MYRRSSASSRGARWRSHSAWAVAVPPGAWAAGLAARPVSAGPRARVHSIGSAVCATSRQSSSGLRRDAQRSRKRAPCGARSDPRARKSRPAPSNWCRRGAPRSRRRVAARALPGDGLDLLAGAPRARRGRSRAAGPVARPRSPRQSPGASSCACGCGDRRARPPSAGPALRAAAACPRACVGGLRTRRRRRWAARWFVRVRRSRRRSRSAGWTRIGW